MAREDREHVSVNLRRSQEKRATRKRAAPARLDEFIPEAQHGVRDQGAQPSPGLFGPLLAVQRHGLESECHQGAQPRPGALGTLLAAQQEQARRQRRQEKVDEIVALYRRLQAQAQADHDAQNRHQRSQDQADQVTRDTEDQSTPSATRPLTRSQTSAAPHNLYHSDQGEPAREAAEEQRLTKAHVAARSAFESRLTREKRVPLIDQMMNGYLGATPSQDESRRDQILRNFASEQGEADDGDSVVGDKELDCVTLDGGWVEPANDDDEELPQADDEEQVRHPAETTPPQQDEAVTENARNSSISRKRKRTRSWGSRNFKPSPSRKKTTKSPKSPNSCSRPRIPSQPSWSSSSSLSSASRTPSPFTGRSNIPQTIPREAEVDISLHTTYEQTMDPRRRAAEAAEDEQSTGECSVEREREFECYESLSHSGAVSAGEGEAVVTTRPDAASGVMPGLKYDGTRNEGAGPLSPSMKADGHDHGYDAYDEMQADEDALYQFMQEQFGQSIANFFRNMDRQNLHEQSEVGDEVVALNDFYQPQGVRSSPNVEDSGQQDSEARSTSTSASIRRINTAYDNARATSTAHARMRELTSRPKNGSGNLDYDGTRPGSGSNEQPGRSDRLRSVFGSSRVTRSSSIAGRSNVHVEDVYKGRKVTRVIRLRPGESILVKFVPERKL